MKQPTYLNHTDMAALKRPDLNAEHLDVAQRNARKELLGMLYCLDAMDPDTEGDIIRELQADSDEIKSLPGMQEHWL